jgi:hypothetical protein
VRRRRKLTTNVPVDDVNVSASPDINVVILIDEENWNGEASPRLVPQEGDRQGLFSV